MSHLGVRLLIETTGVNCHLIQPSLSQRIVNTT